MNVIFYDHPEDWTNLLPLTYTRPISELRVGIMTIEQKWLKRLGAAEFWHYTQDYLSVKYPLKVAADNLVINSTVLPDEQLLALINELPKDTVVMRQGQFLFGRISQSRFDLQRLHTFDQVEYQNPVSQIKYLWHLYLMNEEEIEKDFKIITKNRQSAPISSTNTVFQAERVFVEPGVWLECAVLNPNGGYIYIGPNSTVMEGATIRGSVALVENVIIKMQAKIYGATTFGPYSKIGGEVNNSIILGFSNKAHDGYLGNAVLGQWCNLGADTNNSNLKNNYSNVKVWNYQKRGFIDTGLQFVGLFMGDHSKTGINTMLNTGTVVGVSANIFGPGFPRNFIPSFSWGGHHGFTVYQLDKALATAERMMARRKQTLTEADRKILEHIFRITEKYRNF